MAFVRRVRNYLSDFHGGKLGLAFVDRKPLFAGVNAQVWLYVCSCIKWSNYSMSIAFTSLNNINFKRNASISPELELEERTCYCTISSMFLYYISYIKKININTFMVVSLFHVIFKFLSYFYIVFLIRKQHDATFHIFLHKS